MSRIFVLLLICLSSACVNTLKRPDTPNGELIKVTYAPGGPICLDCESLEIVMTSSGKAMWIYGRGSYENWIEERHPISFTPELFLAWETHLEKFRPHGGRNIGEGEASDAVNVRCKVGYSDTPSRIINWESNGRSDWLRLDLGCDPEKYTELLKFFNELPRMVGIAKAMKLDGWVASVPMR